MLKNGLEIFEGLVVAICVKYIIFSFGIFFFIGLRKSEEVG